MPSAVRASTVLPISGAIPAASTISSLPSLMNGSMLRPFALMRTDFPSARSCSTPEKNSSLLTDVSVTFDGFPFIPAK